MKLTAKISKNKCMYCGSNMQLQEEGIEYNFEYKSTKCADCRALLYAVVK